MPAVKLKISNLNIYYYCLKGIPILWISPNWGGCCEHLLFE